MKSRIPASIGALVLFGGCTAFFAAGLGSMGGTTFGALFALLSAGLTVMAVVALVNLLRHEGWEVVLADDAIELPGTPFASRRRDRIPYAAIEFVGLAPDLQQPEAVVFHVAPGPRARWIRQADLAAGDVKQIARALVERVRAHRGDTIDLGAVPLQ
jgi:hypothetical protein